MPVLMRLQRLHEARSFEGLLAVPLLQQALFFEHTIRARRADGDDILVKHHERQPAIPFKRMIQVEFDDFLTFPVFEPKITWNRGIMLVGFSVPLNPGVKLALGDRQPRDEPMQSDFSL